MDDPLNVVVVAAAVLEVDNSVDVVVVSEVVVD